MAKMAFDSQNCRGVDTDRHSYNADRSGFIHVSDPADIKALKAGGYTVVGAVARGRKYWGCDECGRDCNINSCGRCGATDLRKVIE